LSTVIDAIFAVNWLLVEDGTAIDPLLLAARPRGFRAPVIFWHEVASALRTLGVRGALTISQRDTAIARLAQLGVVIDPEPPEISRVLHVSDRYSLTVYDAAYLELASRTGSALASDDTALTQAAVRSGLTVLRSYTSP
jgi:predicted nucleic acid-binding protein